MRRTFAVGRVSRKGEEIVMVEKARTSPIPGPWTLKALIRPSPSKYPNPEIRWHLSAAASPLAALHSFAVPQRVRLNRAPCQRRASALSIHHRISGMGHQVEKCQRSTGPRAAVPVGSRRVVAPCCVRTPLRCFGIAVVVLHCLASTRREPLRSSGLSRPHPPFRRAFQTRQELVA